MVLSSLKYSEAAKLKLEAKSKSPLVSHKTPIAPRTPGPSKPTKALDFPQKNSKVFNRLVQLAEKSTAQVLQREFYKQMTRIVMFENSMVFYFTKKTSKKTKEKTFRGLLEACIKKRTIRRYFEKLEVELTFVLSPNPKATCFVD